MTERPTFPGRPAQPPGKTYLEYSPNGKRLVVAGCATHVRVFNTGDLGEPNVVDDVPGDILAVAAGDDYMILGCEDGSVTQWTLPEGPMDKMLTRCTLPVRDIALSPDEKWVAVCSDELEVKLINRNDMEQIMFLRDFSKPVKHLSFDPSGTYLAASCTDGIIYIYSMSTSEPTLYKKIDGVIRRLESSDDTNSRCVWHPDGRAFACATATRDIVVISISDGEQQRPFTGGHMADIVSLAWSPNGAILASADSGDTLLFWETKTQKVIRKHSYEKMLHVTFHNKGENLFNWTNSWGECFIIPEFFKDPAHIKLLKAQQARSPFFHDPLDEKAAAINGRKALPNGREKPRAGTPDSLDELLGPDPDAEGFDWIDDDDGAGYNENGKRTNGHLGAANGPNGHIDKRAKGAIWQPQIHESFQPGATPWRGNRKYLCLNLIGFVWTVDQDTHNTITVEFYDREMYRDFHFTDPFLYDKACLNENGALFACPATTAQPSMIFYRPHETWTGRADWRISLPAGEEVSCIALSNKYIVATTTVGYVRVWTLFGTPVRIWRLKSWPAVTCTAWGDYVMTVGNGAVASDGCTQLVYSIDDIRRDETHQSEDVMALGAGEEVSLKSVFWSEEGDPWVYDSTGTLLCLTRWRGMGQAKWVPMLETRMLDRLRDGKKEESYWPVAVAQERFHCIILKGGDRYPYFPRPLLSEFEFRVPVGVVPEKGPDDDGEETNVQAGARLEESYVRHAVLLGLLEDLVQGQGRPGHAQKAEVARREIEVDKVLLQLLAVECREGEERQMKALEIVSLLRDRGGKMIEAAGKVAGRYGRSVLEDRIRDLGERRLMEIDED
jgi:chromosome transmission fidelity protein 4